MNYTTLSRTLSALLLGAVLVYASACNPAPRVIETDVLIIGGGASGTMASIQAARMGVSVVLVEETPWLGGMLTSAGVAAIDGNHRLPGGLWGEFRAKLYAHYGGPDAVETGWVSNTLFEPHVGERFLREMVTAESGIQLMNGYRVTEVFREGRRVTGARFTDANGRHVDIRSAVTVAADEYGDALMLAGAAYRYGWEPRADFDDILAPEVGNNLIQDLTYVAILRDFGPDADKTIPRPDGYDPTVFDCTCKELCSDPDRTVVSCGPESGNNLYMFNYGELPNNYFMINWPIKGNDYYIAILDMTPAERAVALEEAKNFTLKWIYFLQTEGGYKHMGIADDVFPTTDNFPFIPYIRESRRIDGYVTLRTQDLLDPYSADAQNRYRSGIAVGDYPLDLHHERKPAGFEVNARTEDKPKIPAYNVPYGTMIPRDVDGLIVAEKSISVTHTVNGATRLQPVVLGLGQAAGAAAALSVRRGLEPVEVDIRELQQVLLDAGAWLMPYADTNPSEADFEAIQRVTLSGIMRGTLVPSPVETPWANRQWFAPDGAVDRVEIAAIGMRLQQEGWPHQVDMLDRSNLPVNQALAIRVLWNLMGSPGALTQENAGVDYNTLSRRWFDAEQLMPSWTAATSAEIVTRRQMAVLLDRTVDPFRF